MSTETLMKEVESVAAENNNLEHQQEPLAWANAGGYFEGRLGLTR